MPMDLQVKKENSMEKVKLLFEIVSGRKDVEFVNKVLAQDVLIDMDGQRFSGIEAWKTWIGCLIFIPWISEIEVIPNYMRVDGDWVIVSANWYGIRRGRRVVSNECVVSYKVFRGYITEIRTKRVNYTFFFTEGIKYRVVFVGVLFCVWVWKCLFRTKL